MIRRTHMVVVAVCLALVTGVIVGCSSSGNSNGGSGGSPSTGAAGTMGGGGSSGAPGGMMGGGGSSGAPSGGMMGGGGSSANTYSSVGQRIFLTGVGSDGREISRATSGASQGATMMGGGGCASCHGADGRGGTVRMTTGSTIEAPDITYDALLQYGFTDVTIPEAIRNGLDENGDPLNEAMPRWQMSDADLDATIAYLKTLSGH